ncbi:hypothetical protein ACIBEJ_08270 [Nonomuraea sp. NPDC050790]|uniref:AMP-binding enzyme n=1 Tax=Nonomuraea sp. NPDC050790 TaxID=3364371 RepID=UPI0037A2458C
MAERARVIERRLRAHPEVSDCAVVRDGDTLIAYAVSPGGVTGAELGAYLLERLPRRRAPDLVAVVPVLPRTPEGGIDRGSLPLPVRAGPGSGGGGKAGGWDGDPATMAPVWGLVAVVSGMVAFALTDVLWPYSTDLTGVPQPWAGFFRGLYAAEYVAFGLGVMFLLFGRTFLARLERPAWLTTLAHLAITWLLVAWWPQDNFYRLAAKTDWSRQAALVYGFNITLMIAAAVVVAYVAARPAGAER